MVGTGEGVVASGFGGRRRGEGGAEGKGRPVSRLAVVRSAKRKERYRNGIRTRQFEAVYKLVNSRFGENRRQVYWYGSIVSRNESRCTLGGCSARVLAEGCNLKIILRSMKTTIATDICS